jgi:two-component system CheB/CheR fusion protein
MPPTAPSRAASKPARAIVGIGASAGGIDDMRRFLAALPADSGLGIVLVMHLRPDHRSHLVQVLQQATNIGVEEAVDGQLVAGDTLYVIPPDHALGLEDGRLRLTPLQGGRRYGLVDQFFQALAADQRDRAVCIVLSGAGSDGAVGLRAIKEHGGLALASAPASATGPSHAHDSMPRAAAETGLADYVVEIAAMPELMLDYIRHVEQLGAASESKRAAAAIEDSLPDIHERILKRTGHDLRHYKSPTLVRRIQRRMHALRIADPATYVARLDEAPQEIDALHRDILIGVTSFFRDTEAFQALERLVFPNIVRDSRATQEGIRIWVPGCGTGEEAFSIAILLREAMERAGVQANAQVFGTDVDVNAIQHARSGLYPISIAEQVGQRRLERFFNRESDGYRVDRGVRDMCLFSEHDLIRHPPFSRMDLISCRNLLIYMDGDLQGQQLPLFHYALRPSGFLFLGSSESLGQNTDLFAEVDKKNRLFRRRDDAGHRVPEFPLTSPAQRQPFSVAPRPQDDDTRQRLTRKAERAVLEQFGPPYVILSQNYEAVYFSHGIGDYLEPPVGAPSSNVLDMARDGLRPAIRRVLRQAESAAGGVSEQVEVVVQGERRTIQLHAQTIAERRGNERTLVLVFQDSAQQSGIAKPMPEARDTAELERELADTKSELQLTIEELEASNEELQSANEELLSMNEELQSSNEELEASKEEVQSANEELETTNDELRRKVEELDRANADMRNLMESTRIATVFLDTEQRIKWFSPDARQLFNLIDSDVGRPFTDISGRLDSPPVRELAQTLKNRTPVERQVQLTDGSAVFMMRLLPYQSVEGVVDGLVLTFIDVTQLREASADLTSLMDLVPVGIALTRDAAMTSVRVNRYGRQILGLTHPDAAEIDGTRLARAFVMDRPEYGETPELPLRAATRGEQVTETQAWVHPQGRGETADPARAAPGPDDRAVLVSAMPLGQGSRSNRGAIMAFADVTELKTAQRRQRLLLSALQHRVRNMLANIRAITNETLRNSQTLDDFEERFQGRMDALALTENITSRTGRGSIDLDELVRELVAREPDAGTVTIEGPDVALEPKAAQILALALNELKTNAIKHGALIDGSGRVTLRWGPVAETSGRELLRLRWQESGVGDFPEQSYGFGRELIERGVPHELGGRGQMWTADGVLTCLLDIPFTPNVLSIGAGDSGPDDGDDRRAPQGPFGGRRE